MDEKTFKTYAELAKGMGGDYGAGYLRGLRRHYHGKKFGTTEEHETWLAMTGHRQEMGDGYRDGFAGQPPSRRPGRPTRLGARPRNVSLDDERAEFARELGGGNLSEGIRIALDMARGDQE